jgi:flagellar FliL protein
VVFVDVPDILVNLQTAGSRMRFLKLRLSLEVADEPAAQAVRTLMPRLLDSFQLYLRALTVDDLSGPGGVQRLKEDLVARSNIAAEPVRVKDVLLKEMLVQ